MKGMKKGAVVGKATGTMDGMKSMIKGKGNKAYAPKLHVMGSMKK